MTKAVFWEVVQTLFAVLGVWAAWTAARRANEHAADANDIAIRANATANESLDLARSNDRIEAERNEVKARQLARRIHRLAEPLSVGWTLKESTQLRSGVIGTFEIAALAAPKSYRERAEAVLVDLKAWEKAYHPGRTSGTPADVETQQKDRMYRVFTNLEDLC